MNGRTFKIYFRDHHSMDERYDNRTSIQKWNVPNKQYSTGDKIGLTIARNQRPMIITLLLAIPNSRYSSFNTNVPARPKNNKTSLLRMFRGSKSFLIERADNHNPILRYASLHPNLHYNWHFIFCHINARNNYYAYRYMNSHWIIQTCSITLHKLFRNNYTLHLFSFERLSDG
jgi:hypothetical protein